MTTNPITITAASAPPAPASATNVATSSLTQNYNTFLTLLTTQLKNQDPTSPMDSSQFTQQLVMYSQVEQQINTNSKLDQLVSATNAGQTSAALGYIGMQVNAPGSSFAYSGQPVTLGYALPSDTASAVLSITDSNGATVWTGTANNAQGSYNVTWNGTDMNGNPVANGTYGIALTATDSTNTPVNGTTSVPGIVSGIETESGSVYLTVNGASVPESSVTIASNPASTPH
jgi:flagellar basal-body rod modification protein FlgD